MERFAESLRELKDPRRKQGLRYSLETVFVSALMAMIAGCDAEAMAVWSGANEEWLDTFLDMPHGGPSQDVILSVFASLGTMSALSRDQVEVLELADVPRALAELMVPSGRTDRTKFRDQIIAPLLDAGLLAMTVPDKPRSPKQRYQATAAGLATLQAARRS